MEFKTIRDKRGEIRQIAQNVDVLRIITEAGNFRASHWHRTTSHLCVVNIGAICYYERPVNSQVKPTRKIVHSGDYFYTGPQVEHQMVMKVYTEFDCYSFGSREKENYESDLVRFDWDLEKIYNDWPN